MIQLRKVCNHPYLFLDYNDRKQCMSEEIIKSSGKFEILDRMILKLLHTNHRILIFSQMTRSMDLLGMFLEMRKIKYLRLDGNTKAEERFESMQEFNEKDSEYKIFLLSTRAGGLGLNL